MSTKRTTMHSHLKSLNTKKAVTYCIENLVLVFGHAKKCGRLIQFMGSKSPSLDVCIDLVHHEALSVTHRWSHFNYSPLTSNQSMINYMYGLLTMIMKITHIVEERLIICFQQKYTCTYICTGKWMIISWKKGCVTCNVQSVELKERVCYMC